MPRCLLLLPLLALLVGSVTAAPQDDQYKLGPDSRAKEGVPRGQVVPMPPFHSTIYPGTTHQWWLYVPAQYDAAKPACVMVFQDGGSSNGDPKQAGPWNATYVFDNLIAAGQMPVTVGVFISPGELPPKEPGGKPVSNRSVEYDTPDGTYGRFLLEEILPEVARKYNLTSNPEARAICGSSSGGICAFKVAWERPDAFQKVVSHIGSFTNIRGGYSYPYLIRKTEAKASESAYNESEKTLLGLRRKIRVFLQDGRNDLDNQYGNWPLANQEMAAALKFSGWDYQFVFGEGTHNGNQGASIFPDTMRWLWRDTK
jgi:enterochelin esterase family protein